MGILVLRKESYQRTFFTWSTCSISFCRSDTSFSGMPSTMHMEKAPVPNSSIRMSCPTMVSMSFGR